MTSHPLDDERIFHIARGMPDPALRQEYIEQICAGDRALQERVEALLSVYEQEQSFLKSANPQVAATTDQKPITEIPGQEIGRYKLLQKIGEGGFGVVFMAEQIRPVRRKVALKVIKPGMDSHAVVARFEAERQALAMMDHVNIARVLDGGATDTGRPYFVMELVKGVPITEYCDKNQLSTDERLRLFMTVCEAVQHAHHKGIIHRDLKPSNVLVTLADGQAVAKVIDFGVAKATNQQLTEKTLFTAYGQMIGTPQYMSPEQAEMSCLDVDTRSDVYSLGVILYELLTGSTPLEAERLRTAGYAEMQRLIREEEPPKPSTRLSTSGDGLTALAKHRSVSPEKLKSLVRGDLDWIVMKALEKDRNRRYESASGFAEDVGNYLQHEPVGARPPTHWYRAAKAVRRNRATIATLGVISTVLSIALVDTLWINSRLNATVAELWDVIEERALDAAFSGNHEDADKAIQRIAKRAPTELLDSLKAINLLVAGDSKLAIEKLEAVAQSQPENLMVQSVLSWAYHNAAMPGKHADQKVKVHKLLGSGAEPTNDLEEFFMLLGHFLDGSIDRKRENLRSIQALTERHKDWGIAYALSAELQHEIAKELKSKAYFARAIDDFERAERISDSPLVARIGLGLLIDYISLVDSERQDSTSLKAKAATLSTRFDDRNRIASGAEWAAKFNYLYGSQENAAMLVESLVESSEDHCIVKATERNAYDRDRMRIQRLRGSKNAEAKINLAMSLACSTPTPAEQQEIEAIVDDLLNDSTDPVFLVLAMDIPCILKNEEMFKKVERATEQWRDENFGWRLGRHVFDFYFDRISGDELLELAHPFSGDLGVAHYVIGMKCLYNQDVKKAEVHLRKTVEMRGVGQWAYHTAKLLLSKLSEKPEFRQRFAATHNVSVVGTGVSGNLRPSHVVKLNSLILTADELRSSTGKVYGA